MITLDFFKFLTEKSISEARLLSDDIYWTETVIEKKARIRQSGTLVLKNVSQETRMNFLFNCPESNRSNKAEKLGCLNPSYMLLRT